MSPVSFREPLNPEKAQLEPDSGDFRKTPVYCVLSEYSVFSASAAESVVHPVQEVGGANPPESNASQRVCI